jgi:hypothetical protein
LSSKISKKKKNLNGSKMSTRKENINVKVVNHSDGKAKKRAHLDEIRNRESMRGGNITRHHASASNRDA